MNRSPFVEDILAQPDALRRLGAHLAEGAALAAVPAVQPDTRVVLTGMGASLHALLPAWLRLVRAGHPAWHLETAQLLRDAPELITPGTVVIAASQSGHSAELVALAGSLPSEAYLLVLTNDTTSPLAAASDRVIDIHAGAEHTVSTRSFVTTLAAAAAAAAVLTGATIDEDYERIADALDEHLSALRDHIDAATELVGLPERLYVLGRGTSLAAVACGALVLKEAAKWNAEGMSSAQFRHGPLELADERLTAIVLAGEGEGDRCRNRLLHDDLQRFGATALWADDQPGAALRLAPTTGLGHAMAEIVALQTVSVAIAEQTGRTPGDFRHIGKVTTVE